MVRVVVDGRRVRKRFDTEFQARQFLGAVRLDGALRDVGLPGIVRRRPMLLDVIKTFLADAEARKVAPATLEYYYTCLAGPRAWVAELRPQLLAAELDTKLVQRYVAWRVGRKLTAKSTRPASEVMVSKELTILAMVYRNAMLEPAWKRPAKLKSRGEGKRILSPEQLQGFLAAMPVGSLERTVAETAAATGMRPVDIRALTWGQVDFEDQLITFVAKKTGKAQVIPLAMSLVPHLEAWKARRAREGNLTPDIRPEDQALSRVFLIEGRPIQKDTLRKPFRRASLTAGIHPPIEQFGCARNSVAAHLLARGEPAYLVAALLGHADLRTTMAYARQYKPTDELRGTIRSLEASHEASRAADGPGHFGATRRAESCGFVQSGDENGAPREAPQP